MIEITQKLYRHYLKSASTDNAVNALFLVYVTYCDSLPATPKIAFKQTVMIIFRRHFQILTVITSRSPSSKAAQHIMAQ